MRIAYWVMIAMVMVGCSRVEKDESTEGEANAVQVAQPEIELPQGWGLVTNSIGEWTLIEPDGRLWKTCTWKTRKGAVEQAIYSVDVANKYRRIRNDKWTEAK